MKRLAAIIVIVLLIPLAGCKPAGKALASLQYHNLDWKLTPSIMTITVGDGNIDMKRLMKKETFAGSVCQGHVTVEYPEGLRATACELAQEFDEFYPIVKQKLGISWDFDLVLKLIRVPPGATGFRYSAHLKRKRYVVFPIPVENNCPNRRWTPVVAHELTEASLIAPRNRSQLVLADLWVKSYCIPTGARWFRDGVSDYSLYLFTEQPPPEHVYTQLNQVKHLLLDWANYDGSPNWYDAACGLICEMSNRYGEDSVARFMCELAKEPVPGGYGLKQAFKRTTGTDLETFLATYETPWIGIEVCQSKYGVRVVSSYPATPASRRGIYVDDVIINLAGQPIRSKGEFTQVLARQKPWDIVPIVIRRDNRILPMKVKLIPRPTDMSEFLKLSSLLTTSLKSTE